MSFENTQDPEFLEKLKSAKTAEELMGSAKEEGIEFSDEQLQAIAGGYYTCGEAVCWEVCPFLDLIDSGFFSSKPIKPE